MRFGKLSGLHNKPRTPCRLQRPVASANIGGSKRPDFLPSLVKGCRYPVVNLPQGKGWQSCQPFRRNLNPGRCPEFWTSGASLPYAGARVRGPGKVSRLQETLQCCPTRARACKVDAPPFYLDDHPDVALRGRGPRAAGGAVFRGMLRRHGVSMGLPAVMGCPWGYPARWCKIVKFC